MDAMNEQGIVDISSDEDETSMPKLSPINVNPMQNNYILTNRDVPILNESVLNPKANFILCKDKEFLSFPLKKNTIVRNRIVAPGKKLPISNTNNEIKKKKNINTPKIKINSKLNLKDTESNYRKNHLINSKIKANGNNKKLLISSIINCCGKLSQLAHDANSTAQLADYRLILNRLETSFFRLEDQLSLTH